MRKFNIVVLLTLLLLFVSCQKKQDTNNQYLNGSGVKLENYDSLTVENLHVLCKVWGFLKYYHPAVTDGEYNWDFELFKVIPTIIEARSTDARNQVLHEWIKSLGDVEPQKNTEPINRAEFKLLPDLDWTKDSELLGNDVVKLLADIKNTERKKSHYVALNRMADNPIFKNEEAYADMDYLDAGYRLLALFRYWNIIQYYFPYKYLVTEDWNTVLSYFIPQFINAKDALEYRLTLLKLISQVQDTHANFYDPLIEEYKGNNIVPFEISFVENRAVVTDLYKPVNLACNIKIGDVINKIDGEPVDSIVKRLQVYTPASNPEVQLRDIAFDLLRTNKDQLYLEYEQDGKVFTDTFLCRSVNKVYSASSRMQKAKHLVRLLDNENITYLYLGSLFGGKIPDNIDTKGIIIDLRCYPSIKLIDGYWDFKQLYSQPTGFVKFTQGSIKQPGAFKFSPIKKVGENNPDYYKGLKVVLINELTQSHAEFMAMKYRCAPNTIVIGSTTAGADGNVSYFTLPGGIKTQITGLGIYYPDGTETQQIGIIPDIEVRPTIKGIREGRDEVLEKAIELIKVH